jgi:hypothetical protein
MRRGLGVAATLGMLALAPDAHATPTGRILVSLRDPATASAVMADAGVVSAGAPGLQIAMVPVRPPEIVPLSVALQRLRSDPRVRAAQREDRSTLR